MICACFYHCWADGAWREPLAEHLAALQDSRFEGPFVFGVVGRERNRVQALAEVRAIRAPQWSISADTGFEQVTLNAVWAYAREHHGAVLYAHTKGAHDNSEFRAQWRRAMSALLIGGWRENLAVLDGAYDAVGCHWLTAREFPGVVADTPFPMFGGNFWMARTDYLRRLPAPSTGSRHDAEAWIGLRNPRVLDLSPGWPGATPFPRVKVRRLVANAP